MVIGSQYGEEKILRKFFNYEPTGTVVDVGAADGLDNSNSHCLLTHPGWSGVLVEPESSQFRDLEARYAGRSNVRTVNCAVGQQPGKATFHVGGEGHKQGSTMLPEWKQKVITEFNGVYLEPIQVQVRTLSDILEEAKVTKIDFLTIDCEGMDDQVLKSMDWKRWQPRLICLEGRGFSLPGNYSEFCMTRGNVFYVRDSV
jgi:FkbM family methyltransferase